MDGCDVMVWIGPGSFLPGVAGVGGAGVRGGADPDEGGLVDGGNLQ